MLLHVHLILIVTHNKMPCVRRNGAYMKTSAYITITTLPHNLYHSWMYSMMPVWLTNSQTLPSSLLHLPDILDMSGFPATYRTFHIFQTRNTLDCDQSNVYSSRNIFSSISPNLPLCSFSLCFRLASGPVLRNKWQSPITCVNSHYRVREQSMVCVHT